MDVKLLHVTPLNILIKAIRVCHDSEDKSDSKEELIFRCDNCGMLYTSHVICPCNNKMVSNGKKMYMLGFNDRKLVKRIIKDGHTSTLEHINFTFKIYKMPRFVLQELARHRHQNLSVKSTRYTLKKDLAKEKPFTYEDIDRASKYVELTNNDELNKCLIHQLEGLRQEIINGLSNDDVKFMLPEAYKTDLISTFNARSLRNFFQLRLDKAAHFKIRELAERMYDEIIFRVPEYRILFEDIVKK